MALVGSRSEGRRRRDERRGTGRVDELPDTLRGLVAARLDALDAEALAVLQDAAVIGRTGPIEGLREMESHFSRSARFDDLLVTLVTEEILDHRSATCGAFRSDLVREVAYQTITKIDRAKRHAGIADYIEHEKYADHLAEPALIDQLAHHYGLAVELADELGVRDQLPARPRRPGARAGSPRRPSGPARAEMLPTGGAPLQPGAGPPRRRADSPSASRSCRAGPRRTPRPGICTERAADADRAAEVAAALGDEDGRGLRAGPARRRSCSRRDGPTRPGRRCTSRPRSFAELGDTAGRADALRQLGHGRAVQRTSSTRRTRSCARRSRRSARSATARGEAWASRTWPGSRSSPGASRTPPTQLEQSIATFAEIGDTRRSGLGARPAGVRPVPAGQRRGGRVAGRADPQGSTHPRRPVGRRHDAHAAGDGPAVVRPDRRARWRTSAKRVTSSTTSATSYGLTMSSATLGRGLAMVGRVDDGLALVEKARTTSGGRRAASVRSTSSRASPRCTLAAIGVQIGDPAPRATRPSPTCRGATSASAIAEAPPERRVALALAAMQARRLEAARRPSRSRSPMSRPDAPPSELAARSLLAALEGGRDVGLPWPSGVLATGRSTYLDRVFADLAVALDAARHGDGDRAAARLTAAARGTQSTGDRLSTAVVLLAAESIRRPPRVRAASGGPTGDARTRLDAMGIRAEGWSRLFDLAAGVTRVG